MLTSDAFERARAYLFANGRPVDRERFRFHFESGSAADVLAALAAYQNADGGFGHGLEADLRADASSPIATATAFRILREVGRPRAAMVSAAVAYLAGSFDRDRSVWEMVTAEVESAPHAPWWTYAGTEKAFDGFRVNPTAEILGALYDYADEAPADLLAGLAPIVVERAEAEPDRMDINTFDALLRFVDAVGVPVEVRAEVEARLLRAARATIALDPSTWDGYVVRPMDALGTPDSFLAPAIPAEAVAANADYWVDRQLPDGSWPVPWDWAAVDAEAWAAAERDWKGKLIVDRLVVLKAFGQL